MSFTQQPQAPIIPNRSQLFVPCSKVALFEKAAKSAADVIVLDLEDSVSPDEKAQARKNAVAALQDVVWGDKAVSLRINGLDTHFCYRDVVDVLENAGERLDRIMIPKVGNASDLYAIDMLVSQIEAATGRKKPLQLEIIMENAAGFLNVAAIAAASKRLVAVHFGAADYAASMGMATTGIGGTQELYAMLSGNARSEKRDLGLADPWHAPMVQMVAACRASGILPVDGPFGDYSDPEGYKAQARRSHLLGCVGKWAIHPGQVALANETYTPSEALIAGARRILDAMEKAKAEGLGAVTLDGKLIDLASVRQAEGIVKQTELLKRA